MDDAQFTINLLKACWPMEAEAIGPTYLREVANGRSDFRAVPGAAHIDYLEVLKTLVQAVTLINTSIQIAKAFKSRHHKAAKSDEIKRELEEGGHVPRGTTEDQLDRISADVAELAAHPS